MEHPNEWKHRSIAGHRGRHQLQTDDSPTEFCRNAHQRAVCIQCVQHKGDERTAAIRYQGELAGTCANLKAIGYDFDTSTLDKSTELVRNVEDSVAELEKIMANHSANTLLAEAKHACNDILPAMLKVRQYADSLESIIADDLWPLPTYQEILFIK